MSPWEMLAVVVAGVWAGTINTIVGSGTLVTFPVLLGLGVPPVVANVSNCIGLVGGGITGVVGYLPELRGAGRLLRRLIPMSFLGAVIGAGLLLVLPEDAFSAIVPVLIALGLVLVVTGPRLQRRAARRRAAAEAAGGGAAERGATGGGATGLGAVGVDGAGAEASAGTGWRATALLAGVLAAGVYGGYFGAAQGVILIGLLSALTTESLQRLNGVKNVLGTVVNAVAALTFVVVSPEYVDWTIALLIGVGALLGGVIGSRVGRRLPPTVLRGVIVVIGLAGIISVLRG